MSRRMVLAIILSLAALVPGSIHSQTSSQPTGGQGAVFDFAMSSDATTVSIPSTVLVTFRLTNTGAEKATGVVITDTLPIGWAYGSAEDKAELASLGDLAPGETIARTVPLTVNATVTAGRIAYEAVASAKNAASVQAFVALDIEKGKVLGASVGLAETGNSLGWPMLLGLVALLIGFVLQRRHALSR